MEENGIVSIALVGAESSGKTWLAERLAAHYATSHAPEYAREYFSDRSIHGHTTEDILKVAGGQLKAEQEARSNAQRLFFCDTALISIKIWAELEFKHVPPALAQMVADSRHDFYLVLDNSVPWDPDPLRLNKFDRERILQMHLAEVLKTGSPYELLKGADARLSAAISCVDAFLSSA
jgi:NadR type nicotinamide-nucleotide adenylyltransferase